MVKVRKLSLFVDRTSQQWIVLDADGGYWALPASDNPWDERQPYSPSDETDLEPIPAHYKYSLGLPF
jgi:hypothetical protein